MAKALNLANALARFEEAVRTHEFRGGYPPEDRNKIQQQYANAQRRLLGAISDLGDLSYQAGVKDRKMLPMKDAPQDGTRIIIKCQTFAYSAVDVCQKPSGWHWVEAFWDPHEVHNVRNGPGFMDFTEHVGWWRIWCGKKGTYTTASVSNPQGWMPLPEEE